MSKKSKKARHVYLRNYSLLVFVFVTFSLIGLFLYLLGGDLQCANTISCIRNLTGTYEKNEKYGEYIGQTVLVPPEVKNSDFYPVLGDSTGKGKRIEIDLSTQTLYAFEYDRLVYEFPVSTGKWGRTPTGTFSIWIKLRYTRMTGGNSALGTYYNLPNVPYTMFFYNKEIPKHRGYGIHGAYWHNNFGQPMSHGCINMREEDVAKIYKWANPETEAHTTYATKENPGTTIIIYGTAPQG